MAEESLTVKIDPNGKIAVGRGALQRIAARHGRYRLAPSPPHLLILERIDGESRSDETGVVVAGSIPRLGGLVDIIHFIHSNAWSGQLSVMAGEARKTVYFQRGDVTTAASNVPEDRIGAILYRFGMISAAQLEQTLAQVTPEHRFGQILVENGTLSAHDIYQYVRKQVEEIFYSLLVMRYGEFFFSRAEGEVGPASQILLSTHQLLFEGVHRIDEMGLFREKLPGPEVVLVPRHPPPDEKLPPREARVFQLVDGLRDLGAITRASHLGEFETTRLLFDLLRTGWVQVHGQGAAHVRPTAGELFDCFNRIYQKVFQAVAARGKEEAIARGIGSFFQSAGEYAPLFAGVSLSAEGQLPRDPVLANLLSFPAEDKLDYLYRGLNELLYFELFAAGDAVERAGEAELHQELREILRDAPRPEILL